MTVTFTRKRRKSSNMGRPVTDIDPAQLTNLARLCCTVPEAAAFLGIHYNTLYQKLREPVYREAWDRGYDRGRLSLRRKQMEVALKGSVPMLIWLGKQLLGQSDKAHLFVGEDRNLNLSMLDSEMVTLPWTAELDAELGDVDLLITLGTSEYEEA